MENKETTFTGVNKRAEYKFKTTIAQKANGQIQIKEITVRGDEREVLPEYVFDNLETTYTIGKKKGLNMLSPYEKGREPTV